MMKGRFKRSCCGGWGGRPGTVVGVVGGRITAA
ncbi:hypothetical protein A2U01_0073403, partial [Trifolium medium]|nr:hypothetical protein [Trifolium medium]